MTKTLEYIQALVGEAGTQALFPYPEWLRKTEISELSDGHKRTIFFGRERLEEKFHAPLVRLLGDLIRKDKDGELWRLRFLRDDRRWEFNGGNRPAVFLIVTSEQGEHVLRTHYRFAYRGNSVKSAIAWTFRKNSDYNPKVEV